MPRNATFQLLPQEEANAKLREAILYIAHRCQEDPKFGLTKLNKILYFSDFLLYAKTGDGVTGAEYMKLPQGPGPKQMLPVLLEMQESGELVIQTKEYYGYPQKKPIPLREPDLSLFSADQVAQLDQIIQALSDHNAKEVSFISHDRAWRITKMKESIPYEAAFISDEEVTAYDIERTKALGKELGWAI